jgi:transketolase
MTGKSKELIRYLEDRAKQLRRDVIECIGVGTAGHLGGSFSSADIVAALYFYKMKHDPKNPDMPDRDRFLLSKGHVAILQYAALAEAGYFSRDELRHSKEIGSMLQGHPDILKTPGIEAGTGSLGQGLSIGLGMALGLRMDGNPAKVYVLMGDGEVCEGQIWEAAMAASAYKASNLTGIVDGNGLQATGPIRERMDTGDIIAKWQAFGWDVIEIDGHDMEQIVDALDKASQATERPVVIYAHTVKGKGVSFAENVPGFHNGILTQELYDRAMRELA